MDDQELRAASPAVRQAYAVWQQAQQTLNELARVMRDVTVAYADARTTVEEAEAAFLDLTGRLGGTGESGACSVSSAPISPESST